MEHPITKRTMRLTISEAYDYLTPNTVYRATPRKDYVRIDRDDESSGTFISLWQWDQLLTGKAGASVRPYQ